MRRPLEVAGRSESERLVVESEDARGFVLSLRHLVKGFKRFRHAARAKNGPRLGQVVKQRSYRKTVVQRTEKT